MTYKGWKNEGRGVYSLDMKQFEPLLSLRRQLDVLRTANLTTHTVTWLSSNIKAICNRKTLHYVAVEDLKSVFRGRILKGDDVEFRNVQALWYPPKDKVTGFGRANRKGQQVFYCSSSAKAVIFELDPRPGEMLAILKCRTKPFRCVQLGMDTSLLEKVRAPQQIVDAIDSWQVGNDSKLIIDGIPICDISESLVMQSFFHRLFSQRVAESNRNLYKITIAIAELWFENRELAGIVYPTIAHRFKGVPAIVGQNAALRSCQRITERFTSPGADGLYNSSLRENDEAPARSLT